MSFAFLSLIYFLLLNIHCNRKFGEARKVFEKIIVPLPQDSPVNNLYFLLSFL